MRGHKTIKSNVSGAVPLSRHKTIKSQVSGAVPLSRHKTIKSHVSGAVTVLAFELPVLSVVWNCSPKDFTYTHLQKM